MPWDAVVWMNADQVVVWREPDRYKGDRDKVPDRIYYTATLPGRRKPEENEVRRVGLQVEPQVWKTNLDTMIQFKLATASAVNSINRLI